MGQTLINGIFLPNKGERNCYEGLAANWRVIDGYIGGYNVHVADAVIHVSQADRDKWDAVDNKADSSALTAHTGDTTIHVTAADKEAWNGKADASALTAHTGNTTIHVTAADKEAWNGKADSSALTAHTGNTTIHVTAEDKTKWDAVTTKANDTDAVHKSGAETIAGVKTFSAIPIFATFDGIRFRCAHNSNAYVTFRNATQANPGSIILSANDGTTGTAIHLVDKTLIPYTSGDIDLGTKTKKWKSLNGITPGALSLPDLTAGVDISGYITDITGAANINKFTPTADGWISIGLANADFIEMYIPSALMGGTFTKSTVNNYGQAFMPVIANKEVRFALKGSSIGWAKFYPCQGNI